MDDTQNTSSGQANWFTTTHWSQVLNAGSPGSPQAAEALEKLCRAYWYPLYAFARRQGNDKESAEDLTQGFFASFLEKDFLAQVSREKGKFRSLLLASFKHFMADQWDKQRAIIRGGGQTFVWLDNLTSEDRLSLEPADVMTPEKLFDRSWALTVLEHAKAQLKDEYLKKDQVDVYDRLNSCASGENGGPAYAEVAAALGLAESGVKAAVFRMRQRYRELVREEVSNTLDSPTTEKIDEEIRYLVSVLRD